ASAARRIPARARSRLESRGSSVSVPTHDSLWTNAIRTDLTVLLSAQLQAFCLGPEISRDDAQDTRGASEYREQGSEVSGWCECGQHERNHRPEEQPNSHAPAHTRRTGVC